MDSHPASDNQPPSQQDVMLPSDGSRMVVMLPKLSASEIMEETSNIQSTGNGQLSEGGTVSAENLGTTTGLGSLDMAVSEPKITKVSAPVSSGLAELLSALSTSNDHLTEGKELAEQFHPPANVDNLFVLDLEHFVPNGEQVDSATRQKDTALKDTQQMVTACIISLLPLCELMIKRGDTDGELGEVSKSVLQSLKLAFHANSTLVDMRKDLLRTYVNQAAGRDITKPDGDSDDAVSLQEKKSSIPIQPEVMLDIACDADDRGDDDHHMDDDSDTIPILDDISVAIKDEELESIADEPPDKSKKKKRKGKKQHSSKKKAKGVNKKKPASDKKKRAPGTKKRPQENLAEIASEPQIPELTEDKDKEDQDSVQLQTSQDTKAPTEIFKASIDTESQHEGERLKDSIVTRSNLQKQHSLKHATKGLTEVKQSSEATGSYECSICGKLVKHLHTLKSHMRAHTRREYKCPQCNVRFHTLVLLKAHMAIHPDIELHKCPQCSKTFYMKRVLKRHMKVHTPKKQEECTICGEIMYDTALQRHLKKHSQNPISIEKPHKCSLCSISFTTAQRLEKHKVTHIIKHQTQCSYCTKKYPTATSLRRHVLTHHWSQAGLEMPAVKCTVCDKIIIDVNGTLSKHMYCHSEERPYNCLKCGKSFKWKNSLNGHLKIHTGEKRYKCETCGKLFYFKYALQIHNRVHTNERPYQCSVCGKAFRETSNLNKHMKTHKEKGPQQNYSTEPPQTREKNQNCSYCDKRYTDPSSLRRHIKLVHWSEIGSVMPGVKCNICQKVVTTPMISHMRSHNDERPCICQQCGKRFKTKQSLKIHMKIHDGEKNYNCNICGKAFLTKSSLGAHNLVHSNERAHQCSLCGRAFRESGALNKHMLRHTGQRPHKCSHCDKTYTDNHGLKIHMRTHTGERPYKCSECGQTFSSKMPLNRHKMIHTGERPFQCPHCVKAFRTSSDLTRHVATHYPTS